MSCCSALRWSLLVLAMCIVPVLDAREEESPRYDTRFEISSTSDAGNGATNSNDTIALDIGDTVILNFTIEYIDMEGTFTVTAVPKYGDTHFGMIPDKPSISNVVGRSGPHWEELVVGIKGTEISIGEIQLIATWDGGADPIVIWTHTVHVNRVELPIAVLVRYLVVAALFLVVFMIGITTEPRLIKIILRRPWALLIGMFCQFIIMPFTAWSMAKIFQIDDAPALGLVLDGSCPGGTTSNILSVLLDVDYVLSITMTFFSSILALGMMPLNLFIYGRSFVAGGQTVQTPFLEIFIQLALLAVPLGIGILLGWWKPKSKVFAEKYVKPASGVILMCLLATDLPFNLFIFNSPWSYFVIATIFPLVGATAGFAIAKITQLTTRQSSTVALETGVQNALLAVTVLYFFYPRPLSDLATRLPYLILVFTTIEGMIGTVIYMLLKRFYWHGCPYDDDDDERPVVGDEERPGETEVRPDEIKVRPADAVPNDHLAEINGNVNTISGGVAPSSTGNGTSEAHTQVGFGDESLAEINVAFQNGE